MCFSPEADLVAGVAVSAIGIDAVRHVAHPRELVFAAIPLLLGVHQLDEMFVWWGLQGDVPESWEGATVAIYLSIAFLLPLVVPAAIIGIQPPGMRRRVMSVFFLVGLGVSAVLLAAVARGPIGAEIVGRHISYSANLGDAAAPITVLYVVATCGSLLASGDRRLVLFGAANLVVVTFLAWLTVSGLTSLWCAWAAITSVALAAYVRRVRDAERSAGGGPRTGTTGPVATV